MKSFIPAARTYRGTRRTRAVVRHVRPAVSGAANTAGDLADHTGTLRPTSRTAAKSQRGRDRRGSQKHDGPARHQGAASGPERQRGGAQPRQLRRGDWPIRIPICPRSVDAQERQEGHERRHVVEAAPPRDRRGLRSRGARPRAEGRAEGDLARQSHRTIRGRRTAGRRQGAGRRGRQLVRIRRSPSTSR